MKRKNIIFVVIVVLVIAGVGVGAWLNAKKPSNTPRTANAQTGSVIQEVTFTGHLKSIKEATLGFEGGGVVKTMNVKVGDHVSSGQILASVDSRTTKLELAKARADRLSALDQTRISLENAQKDEQNTIVSSVATLERYRQAVRDSKSALDHQREVWQQVVRESGDEGSVAKSSYALVLSAQSAYKAAQEALAEAEKAASKSEEMAKSATGVARSQYVSALQTAPQESGLSSLGAVEELANVKLSKEIITAPFDGVITVKKVDAGEMAVAGGPVLAVETVSELEVTAEVPETDAAKLSVGQKGKVTFDALPNAESVPLEVTYVAPAATIVEGVPTFEVKLRLLTSNDKLKPGLTSNITVETGRRDGVITVPRRSVINREDQQVVKMLDNMNTIIERQVKTGLVGSNGTVEVLQGVQTGDKVIIEQAKDPQNTAS